MCGIIGIAARQNITPQLLDGLKNLEYRGYDSSGLAVAVESTLLTRKTLGKVHELQSSLNEAPLCGARGVAHTRWATHGVPSLPNTHPHTTERLALVHNGIIENHTALRASLRNQGASPRGESDSELIALLLDRALRSKPDPIAALKSILSSLEGSFALAIVFSETEDILAVRRGSPLCVGRGEASTAVVSDPLGFPDDVTEYSWLDDGDICLLSSSKLRVEDSQGRAKRVRFQSRTVEKIEKKGPFQHFMSKEIFEQVQTIPATRQSAKRRKDVAERLANSSNLTFVACGTSFHAALIASDWFEDLAGIPCRAEIASEFRYRKRALRADHTAIFISQSGETADTLASLSACNELNINTIAVVNVKQSSMADSANANVFTEAGREIGVASTKAFTAQLAVLFQLALDSGTFNGHLSTERRQRLEKAFETIEQDIAVVLGRQRELKSLARRLSTTRDLFLIGRGNLYPMALEAALKLKETSYIRAEGFAAGELKHGSIALIEPGTPVIALCGAGATTNKTKSNTAEVQSRGADVLTIESSSGDSVAERNVLRLPQVPEELDPFVFSPALQLLAYHLAVECKTDVDQPRNLAKSVTVE